MSINAYREISIGEKQYTLVFRLGAFEPDREGQFRGPPEICYPNEPGYADLAQRAELRCVGGETTLISLREALCTLARYLIEDEPEYEGRRLLDVANEQELLLCDELFETVSALSARDPWGRGC